MCQTHETTICPLVNEKVVLCARLYIYINFFFLVNKNGGIYGYITPLGRAPGKPNLWLLSVRDFHPIKDAHQWTPASSGTRI